MSTRSVRLPYLAKRVIIDKSEHRRNLYTRSYHKNQIHTKQVASPSCWEHSSSLVTPRIKMNLSKVPQWPYYGTTMVPSQNGKNVELYMEAYCGWQFNKSRNPSWFEIDPFGSIITLSFPDIIPFISIDVCLIIWRCRYCSKTLKNEKFAHHFLWRIINDYNY